MAEQLSFYNLKTKKKFTTGTYKFVTKSGRRFAVATNNGTQCWRIVGKK